jgi:hypothetical protein
VRRAQATSRAGSLVMRLLLMATLWEGPVPWGHSHAHSTDDRHLAEHLARFHPHDHHAADWGWHWHFSYPDWAHCQEEGHQQPLRPQAALVQNSFDVPCGPPTCVARIVAVREARQPAAACPPWDRTGSRIHAALAHAPSAQERLCRLSC